MSSALPRYLSIVGRTSPARYLLARSVPVEHPEGASPAEMWKTHERGLKEYRELVDDATLPGPCRYSLLDLKRALAQELLTACCFCEHDCQMDRREARGYCGVRSSRIASQFMHMGEEEPLVPSYTVFFAGCNLRCVFCQNYDISTYPDRGREVPARQMASRFSAVLDAGGKNINWVGGDPTPHIPYILDVLALAEANIAQIWNSNMYLTEKGMSLLDGVIDVHLTDLKYGNDSCARRLSGVEDYMRIVTRNHRLARSHCEVIIRHLMLPGHLECCTLPVLEWVAEHLPDVPINIMAQYHPEHRAVEFPELRDRVPRKDYEAAMEHARRSGLQLI